MRRVGFKNYLIDRRFIVEKCSFEIYGYLQNYGLAVIQNIGFQFSQCFNCYMFQYQNFYFCNSVLCVNINIGGGIICFGYCQ